MLFIIQDEKATGDIIVPSKPIMSIANPNY